MTMNIYQARKKSTTRTRNFRFSDMGNFSQHESFTLLGKHLNFGLDTVKDFPYLGTRNYDSYFVDFF